MEARAAKDATGKYWHIGNKKMNWLMAEEKKKTRVTVIKSSQSSTEEQKPTEEEFSLLSWLQSQLLVSLIKETFSLRLKMEKGGREQIYYDNRYNYIPCD